ncbi:hypothetical protein EMIT0P201_10116 [Pseudomonas chlororaphis]
MGVAVLAGQMRVLVNYSSRGGVHSGAVCERCPMVLLMDASIIKRTLTTTRQARRSSTPLPQSRPTTNPIQSSE